MSDGKHKFCKIDWAREQFQKNPLPRLLGNPEAIARTAEILYRTYPHQFNLVNRKAKISQDDFQELFQDVLIEMIRKFDPEKANGKNPCNYFSEMLVNRARDRNRAEGRHPLQVSLDDDSGEDGISLQEKLSADNPNIRTFCEGRQNQSNALLSQSEPEQELLLCICSVVSRLHEHIDQNKKTGKNKIRFFRMFYTNDSMAILHSSTGSSDFMDQNDRAFMDSYDRLLLRFVYAREPMHTWEFQDFPLRSLGEHLPGCLNPKELPRLPLINKLLQVYWKETYHEDKSEATFSNQEKAWHSFIRDNLKAGKAEAFET